MKKAASLLLIIASIQFGCDPGVDLEKIEADELISVSCFISPEDTIYRVYLYRAKALGTLANREAALEKGAEVILSDGEQADTLFYNEENSRYEAPKKNVMIEPHSTYYLHISTETGRKIEAACTVPPNPEQTEVAGYRSGDDYIFEVNWENSVKHKYFVMSSEAEGVYESESPWGVQEVNISARFDNYTSYSDQQMEFNTESGIVRNAFLADDPKITIYLRNIDDDMFNFYESYRAYDHWNMNSRGTLFPNFSQPQPIYSNIENGVGIFAAYNSVSEEVAIK